MVSLPIVARVSRSVSTYCLEPLRRSLARGFPRQRPPSMVSARVPPCALAHERSSVHQCSQRKTRLSDEDTQQRGPQENRRPDRERADGLAPTEDAVQDDP
jgi:hypothetical protein